jgi:MFS family permease
MAIQVPSSVPSAQQASPSLWRHRDFLMLWAGQSISLIGTGVSGFALTLVAVLVLRANAAQIALLSGLAVAPRILLGLAAGVWVDRLRRRTILIAADLGRALVLLSVPAAALLHRLTLCQLDAVALLTGLLGICFDVAYPAYLPSLIGRERLAEGNSKLEASAAFAEAAGLGLAGILVQALTAPLAVLVDVCSYLGSAISLALIRTTERRPETPPARREAVRRPSAWVALGEGLRTVASDGVLRALVGVYGIENLFGNIIGTVITLFLVRQLHVPPLWVGLIYGTGGVSAFVGAVLAPRATRRAGYGPTMVATLLAICISAFLMPLAGGPLWLVVALAVGAQLTDGARTIYMICQQTILQSTTPDPLRGRVQATLYVVEGCAIAGGIALGGLLGVTIGYQGALFVACFGRLVAWLWLVCSPIRKLRERTVGVRSAD